MELIKGKLYFLKEKRGFIFINNEGKIACEEFDKKVMLYLGLSKTVSFGHRFLINKRIYVTFAPSLEDLLKKFKPIK